MSILYFAILGGIWLSLIYSAMVTPATVWVIQLSVSRGFLKGCLASAGLAAGQLPWALLASLCLFEFAPLWQKADPILRALTVLFLLWMAYRNARAPSVKALQLVVRGSGWGIFKASLLRSLVMPWRLPLWAAMIVVMSIHLRGPGWEAAGLFTVGCLIGQLVWSLHFAVVASLFGKRVPEDISLHSMNKLRLLAVIVPIGLVLVCLAPILIA